MKETDKIIDAVWQSLNKRIADVDNKLVLFTTRTERAENAGGVSSSTFALLPITNVQVGDLLWCSDCRKIGEGAGVGTGQLMYWNASTSTWKRVSDDANAAV